VCGEEDGGRVRSDGGVLLLLLLLLLLDDSVKVFTSNTD
jgi:hypothetical protein